MHNHKSKGGYHGGPNEEILGLRKLALVGSPNVGKSVVFNRLTGRYATVSNYPGTTVEIMRGRGKIKGKEYEIIDTPGTYTLVPMSEDERITRKILLEEKPNVVVHIVDAKNLPRMLPLTFQLMEVGFPLILAVNMLDEAGERGISIDLKRLEYELGIPVIGTVATERRGIETLKKMIDAIYEEKPSPRLIVYNEKIEKSLEKIESVLEGDLPISKRALGLMLLERDEEIKELIRKSKGDIEEIEGIIREHTAHFKHSAGYVIRRARDYRARKILSSSLKKIEEKGGLAEFIGEITLRPITGFPVLLIVLYAMYRFVGVLGAGTLVDFFEATIFEGYINPWATRLIIRYIPVKIIQEMLVGQYGLITVGLTYSIAIVLPIVTTFFLAFGFLEDAGYIPRLTIMANRIFKKIGLSGKAVLPIVLGLGCVTMATLTTRTLDSKKERVIATLLLALGIPCSAQLGVILGILGYISPVALFLVFAIVGMQILIVGYLASKIIPGESADFMVEIPPIRIPQVSNILTKTYARLEWFLWEAVPLFLLGTFILFVFDKLRILLFIEDVSRPVVTGMLGLPTPATEAFIMGFLRRDFGAAGLFALAKAGQLDRIQTIVSLVVITLFVPCIANFFVMIKERGMKTALAIVSFIFPYAILVGTVVNFGLRYLGVAL
ncbi:MAG: ferrous iron transport protein B [Candidatus Hydrothermarchaeales archaeon]